MQQSTNNLHYLTNETVAASKEVSGAMDDVSGGALRSLIVDEVSEQLENMAQSVEQMNNSVGEIKGVAGKAEEASKQGLNTMRNLVRTREQSLQLSFIQRKHLES